MSEVIAAAQAAKKLDKIFVCQVCGQEFDSQQKGLKHLENCYSVQEDPTVTKVKK